jgi:hypothetical protein
MVKLWMKAEEAAKVEESGKLCSFAGLLVSRVYLGLILPPLSLRVKLLCRPIHRQNIWTHYTKVDV